MRARLPGSFVLNSVLSTLTDVEDSPDMLLHPHKLHLVLHLDLNKTLIMQDTVQQKSVDRVVTGMLLPSVWGTRRKVSAERARTEHPLNSIDHEQWVPDLTQPISSVNPRPDWIGTPKELISYRDWMTKQFESPEYGPEIRDRFNQYRFGFTDEGRVGQPYRPIYDHILRKLQESHPKIMIPAFYTLINSLCRFQMAHIGWFSFSIVFRSFGTDIEDVTHELNEYCAERGLDGSQPGVPDLRVKPENTGFITRRYQRDSSQSPCVLIMGGVAYNRHELDDKRPWQVTIEQLDQRADQLIDRCSEKGDRSIQMCVTLDEMYEHMKVKWKEQSTMAINDDWIWWAAHGLDSTQGKLMLVDSLDQEIRHLFFDDKIEEDHSRIVDVRDINDPGHRSLAVEKWDDYHNKVLIRAEPIEAILDEDYFLQWISKVVPELKDLKY